MGAGAERKPMKELSAVSKRNEDFDPAFALLSRSQALAFKNRQENRAGCLSGLRSSQPPDPLQPAGERGFFSEDFVSDEFYGFDDDDFEGCDHGVGFDEECGDCEQELCDDDLLWDDEYDGAA
jgi:hypothetical protein